MARRARGLPENFTIDLPDDKPVVIGDFLDEEQPVPPIRRTRERSVEPRVERFVPAPQLRAERPVEEGKSAIRNSSVPSIIRYQTESHAQIEGHAGRTCGTRADVQPSK